MLKERNDENGSALMAC